VPHVLSMQRRSRGLLAQWGARTTVKAPWCRSNRLCEVKKKSGQHGCGGRERAEWEGGERCAKQTCSRKEMGELEHFPLVDTQHLWVGWAKCIKKKKSTCIFDVCYCYIDYFWEDNSLSFFFLNPYSSAYSPTLFWQMSPLCSGKVQLRLSKK